LAAYLVNTVLTRPVDGAAWDMPAQHLSRTLWG
jgi:hypothetical protein